MHPSALLPLVFSFLFTSAVSATTIIPFQYLSQLYLASDAVVVVKAGAPYETAENGCMHNDCDFSVLFSLKGPLLPNDEVMLRQFSYSDPWGHLDITGDFIPVENRTYLIFLDNHEGVWRPIMLSYYIFQLNQLVGNNPDQLYWVPVKESLRIGAFPRPDGEIAEPLAVYKKEALLDLLQQYNTHPNLAWDASSARTNIALTAALVSDRALPTGCDFDLGGGLSRWQNQNISFYYDVTSAPADASARFAGALATLNSEYPGLNLTNSGATNFTPDCGDNSVAGQDFINYTNSSLNGNQSVLLFFEDPCNQITNLTNCAGVLGVGGGYMLSSTHSFKGDTWKNAAWGYVVINNGVSACLSASNFERLLTHELTHTLRMDHLDPAAYPNNNMNPSCCNPINTKDRQCMNYVYDAPLPVELISFEATVVEDQVALRWSTAQEVDNNYFILERSKDGLHFEQLDVQQASGATNFSNYETRDAHPYNGLNYYRLIQVDLSGKINPLATRAVTFKGSFSGYIISPNPVNANLLWVTNPAKEWTLESLEIWETTGRVMQQQQGQINIAGDRLDISIDNLPAGVYWLKVKEADGQMQMLKFIRL